MRLIYWGTVLTLAGICSATILGFVAFMERFVENYQPYTNAMSYEMISMPTYYIALIHTARLVMFFSLPLTIAIEAYVFLKGRKSDYVI